MELIIDEFGEQRHAPIPVEAWQEVMRLLGLDPEVTMALTIGNEEHDDINTRIAASGGNVGRLVMKVHERHPGPVTLIRYVGINLWAEE